MDEKIRQSWERFLNPESLRANVVAGSLFIAAFEMLKSSIIDRIRDFFSTGFNQSGPIIDEKYKELRGQAWYIWIILVKCCNTK